MRLLATFAVTLAALIFLPSAGRSLEIKNFRLTYGEGGASRPGTDVKWQLAEIGTWLKEQGGAARSAPEVVLGETLHVAFDIHGTTNDGQYEIIFKLYYVGNGKIHEVRNSKLPMRPLNDGQPTSMQLPIRWRRRGTWDSNLSEGKYVVRIIVVNKATKDIDHRISKNIAYVDYPVTAVPPTFAIVDVDAPAAAMTGQKHVVKLSVVEPKDNYGFKYPQSDVTLRFVNEGGTEVLTLEAKQQAEKERIEFSVPTNEAGRFELEIEARSGNSRATVRYRVNVEEKGK